MVTLVYGIRSRLGRVGGHEAQKTWHFPSESVAAGSKLVQTCRYDNQLQGMSDEAAVGERALQSRGSRTTEGEMERMASVDPFPFAPPPVIV